MPYLVTEDGTELFYRDLGTGTPVVLIHGWPLSGDMWENQMTYLAEHGLRVIVCDRRGFGRSDQPWNGYDYDTLASDVNDLLTELDLHGATLVGYSMGGGEVVRYLSLYGTARVNKAVLVSAVTPYLTKTDDNPDGVDPKVFAEMEQQIRDDRPNFFHGFGPKLYGRSVVHHTVSEPQLEWTQSMALTGSQRATLATLHSFAGTDFREDLKTIHIPVLIIQGTSDQTVPIDVSGRRTVKMLSNATLAEYDGEPHGLFLTAADRLNKDLLDFVGGQPEPITAPLS